MCDCDCNPPTFFSQAVYRSKKKRQCDECRKDIEIGEHYFATSGMWDGEFSQFSSHTRCEHFRRYAEDETGCCIPFSYIDETLNYEDMQTLWKKWHSIRGGAHFGPVYIHRPPKEQKAWLRDLLERGASDAVNGRECKPDTEIEKDERYYRAGYAQGCELLRGLDEVVKDMNKAENCK